MDQANNKESAIATIPQSANLNLTSNDVKKYICPEATDKELYQFIQLCRSQNLDPWRREAYLIKYGTAPATMVVGKDVFTKRAQANQKFKGFEAGIIVQRGPEVLHVNGSFCLPKDILVGGWAKVHVSGYSVPIEATVSMSEYSTGKSNWAKIPATMIRKVALVQALREAFPEDLGGLYDAAEMRVSENLPEKPIEATIIEHPSEEIKRPARIQSETQPQSEFISEAQRKRLYAIAKTSGFTDDEIKEHLSTQYFIESTKLIKIEDYEDICSWASTREPGMEG